MKYIALALFVTIVGCSPVTTKKTYNTVEPKPFTYSDCMRINGNETFCRQNSAIELANRK